MSKKKYKCPYCQYSGIRDDLIEHVGDEHEDMIPEGYSPRRIVYNKVNRREQGVCMICKGPTPWNEKAGKYDKLCGKESCKKRTREIYEERMLRVHHTTCLLNDETQQEKMLANRGISKKYKYSTGEEFIYTGTYERKLLEFEDSIGISAKDILMPGPVLEYKYEGKTHKWITDQLIIPWNLIIEVKDGGDNPNTRPMDSYRNKQVAKELMITELGTFNYIRLTNNQFDQLLGIFAELKAEMIDDSDENRKAIIRIHEGANAATNAMPSMADGCYVVAYGYRKNVFSGDDIEGIALSKDMIPSKLYTIDDNKVSVKEADTFLKDRKFNIYKYTGKSTLREVVLSAIEKKEVPFNYFYTKLTESDDIYSYGCTLESTVFKEVNIEYINGVKDAYISTITHQYNEASNTDELYLPIINPRIDSAKREVIGDNKELDVLKDVEGYFVLNKTLNQRSASYPSVFEIPKDVVSTIANKNIKEAFCDV